MLSNSEKSQYRSLLFRHLDGIGIAPVAYALKEKGILEYILKEDTTSLSKICENFTVNEGYLNVGLRLLASQGWIQYKIENEKDAVYISKNDKSGFAFSQISRYKEVVHFIKNSEKFHTKHIEQESFLLLIKIFNKFKQGAYAPSSKNEKENEIEAQIEKHIEGILLGPITVFLGMDGMFHKYFMEASFSADEFHEDPMNFSKILDFLTFLGWFVKKDNNYHFTDKGLFFARRSSAYGVTVSYLPTFRKVDELMFGNALYFKNSLPVAQESHVDREMNVWGSGGAHSAYFRKIDEIIISLFNKPIEEQPKGILDMGCGNGAFLIHLFEVIEQRTKRGEMLEEHPLFLVGVDFNKAALKVTRANLVKADIWAKVIWGDIANPQQLEKDIKDNYNMNLQDLLNVRTFLDHNRPWSTPKKLNAHPVSTSSGAFTSCGERLSNSLVEQNLKEHFENWKPYIGKFGLLLIELHTLNPDITSENLGKTPATAYDATHGFSDQYIVELDVFSKVISKVGLDSDPKYFSKFPDSELATVSINYLIDR